MNEASACFRNRTFDFTQSVNGNLAWQVDKNFQGADLGVTEFDASDIDQEKHM